MSVAVALGHARVVHHEEVDLEVVGAGPLHLVVLWKRRTRPVSYFVYEKFISEEFYSVGDSRVIFALKKSGKLQGRGKIPRTLRR